ncbi:MAG: hypothetical protein K9K78_07585 [Spirochaetales bacterium]|nr:hypothetical protein [Spirochaetales bacterium]
MQEKHFTDCFFVISNYLWDGKTESQKPGILYCPHESADRLSRLVPGSA